jgi:hypothetical protein
METHMPPENQRDAKSKASGAEPVRGVVHGRPQEHEKPRPPGKPGGTYEPLGGENAPGQTRTEDERSEGERDPLQGRGTPTGTEDKARPLPPRKERQGGAGPDGGAPASPGADPTRSVASEQEAPGGRGGKGRGSAPRSS